jgi:hypothetical protein
MNSQVNFLLDFGHETHLDFVAEEPRVIQVTLEFLVVHNLIHIDFLRSKSVQMIFSEFQRTEESIRQREPEHSSLDTDSLDVSLTGLAEKLFGNPLFEIYIADFLLHEKPQTEIIILVHY